MRAITACHCTLAADLGAHKHVTIRDRILQDGARQRFNIAVTGRPQLNKDVGWSMVEKDYAGGRKALGVTDRMLCDEDGDRARRLPCSNAKRAEWLLRGDWLLTVVAATTAGRTVVHVDDLD